MFLVCSGKCSGDSTCGGFYYVQSTLTCTLLRKEVWNLKKNCIRAKQGFISFSIQEYIPTKKMEATASSGNGPDKAIDGIIIPNSDANLFHSLDSTHPWFVVDLGHYFNVNLSF